MDPNNSGFIVEDAMNESDFTAVSSIGVDIKQIAEKIKKLEDMALKNAKGSNNVDQSGMLQIGWQMGKEFSKMELKMDGISKENMELKNEMVKIMKAFEELKKEVGKFAEENYKLKDKNAEKVHEMEAMKKEIEEMKVAKQNDNREFEDMKEENLKWKEGMAKLKEEMDREFAEKKCKINELKLQIIGKNAELEEKIAGLKEENGKLKEKMLEMQGKIEETKMTEQNVVIEWIKYDWNAFKFNKTNHGSKLVISEEGFVAKHSGSSGDIFNSVLANFPIPPINLCGINKPRIVFYFEVNILNKISMGNGIIIGFCRHQFPVVGKYVGMEINSIGIWHKDGILIDGNQTKFKNASGRFDNDDFKEGNFIGMGIIHQPNSKLECFATCNGKLLGKAEMLSKFANIQIYPAISLYYAGESIRINFDKENCQFKEFERIHQ